MTRGLGVAEAKKRFSEIVARTAYAGDRYVIERRKKPLAAIVSIDDLGRLEGGNGPGGRQPRGLLAAARLFAGWKGFDAVMADVVRRRSPPRRHGTPAA